MSSKNKVFNILLTLKHRVLVSNRIFRDPNVFQLTFEEHTKLTTLEILNLKMKSFVCLMANQRGYYDLNFDEIPMFHVELLNISEIIIIDII